MELGPSAEEKKNIMIALPSYDGKAEVDTMFCITRASNKDEHNIIISKGDGSSITRSFNSMWADALNQRKSGLTHFAMIHADVVAEHGWLEKMLDLMDTHKADVMSAIIAMKTAQGYVSTATDESNGAGMGTPEHYAVSNLNLRELYNMKDATFTDPALLVNTGLMVVDMRKPWVENVCFRFENDIIKVGEEYKSFEISEDWYFSREAAKLGARLYATREVKVRHIGKAAYSNAVAWGSAGMPVAGSTAKEKA